jgi:hypothetical protein
MIDIKKLITPNTNIIEIYLMKKSNIFMNANILRKIKQSFKKTKQFQNAYYCRNNCNYVYDLTNDSQYVYTRKLENVDKINEDFYVLVYNEIKLPTHTFACTNDINYKQIADIIEFKINNRIILIIKNNNVYIHYKHNKDVDVDKIQDVINNIASKLKQFNSSQ